MLEVKGLSFRYESKKVLDDLDVSFCRGEITSVIGENGCGKSTLIKNIAGILMPDRGSISIDGKDLSILSQSERAKLTAYLAQSRSVPNISVEQMVLHGRFPYLSYPRRYSAEDKRIAQAAMASMGVLALRKQNMSSLSGGMRQNAFIAMALCQDTDFILLDEPTTYLDISRQLDLLKTLRTLAEEGKGIVTVIHDIPLALNFSDKVCVISEGKVSFFGTPEDFMSSGICKKVFGVDIKKDCGLFSYTY